MSKEAFENMKPRIKRIDMIVMSYWDGLCQEECYRLIVEAPELTPEDREYLKQRIFIGYSCEREGIPSDWGARTGFILAHRISKFDHDLDVAPGYCAVE